jgi:hypothetical protein
MKLETNELIEKIFKEVKKKVSQRVYRHTNNLDNMPPSYLEWLIRSQIHLFTLLFVVSLLIHIHIVY